MRNFMGRFAAVAVMLVLTAATVRAAEEKIAIDKLPGAVAKAVKAKFPKAELVSAEAGEEDGKKQFEVEIKNDGKELDVTLSPDGKILMVEKEIPTKDLPKAVANAVETKYPKAAIKFVEEVSKEDKVTGYEVTLTTADKKNLEAEFDAAGKFVGEEKAEEEKK